MARVVVIGAGLSGLAAAARLARLKHDVIVCERSSGPGGQAGRYERDGFAFDTGPTTLTMPASYRDLFIKTGKTTPLENYLDLRPVEPAVRWCFSDGTRIDIPNASRAGVMAAVGAAFGADAAQAWEDFLACGAGVWEQFRWTFLNGPPALSGRRFRVPAAEKSTLDTLNPDRSYAALTLRHLKGHHHLAQAAHSWPARLGGDPFAASAGMVLWPWLEHTFGVWMPTGGVRALVDVVAERARSRGADIRYDTTVSGLEIADGKIAGVRLNDGAALPADVVVAGVDDWVLSAWLTGYPPKPARDRSGSAFTMLLALRGPDDGPFQQMLFPPESRAPFPESPTGPVLTLTRAQAPENCSAYTVSVPAYPHSDDREDDHVTWTAPSAERAATSLIAMLDAHGLNVSGRLIWHEIRSPRDLVDSTGNPDGAMGGPALHGPTGLIREPNATSVRGLFHVGAAAHPGPGIAFAPLGAALVADAVGRAR